jgi:hypothetical protein
MASATSDADGQGSGSCRDRDRTFLRSAHARKFPREDGRRPGDVHQHASLDEVHVHLASRREQAKAVVPRDRSENL